MEHRRGEARGAPEGARRPQGPLIGSKTISNVRPDTDGHLLQGQAASRTARSPDSPKGTAPGPAAPHASPAFLESNDAQPRRPLPYAAQPVADHQPHNGIPPTSPSDGQQHNPAVSVAQQPPVASPPDRQSETKSAGAPIGAARPMPATSTEACSRPPNPVADAHSGTLVHGSSAAASPVGQLSADGGHAPSSKPILKMKRTGQNFPIASSRSSSPLRAPASLHQKKAPWPDKKTGPGTPVRLSTTCRTNALELG